MPLTPPRSSAKRTRRPTKSALSASRNSSASVGGDRLEARDAPGGARGVQQRLLVGRRGRASRRRPRCARRARGGRPAGRRALHLDAPEPLGGAAGPQLATVPLATSPPSLMIATASQRRSTSSSWWLENRTGTPASRARATRTSLMTSTPTGSRPLNGSSRMRAIGSWTSAVASCTRCWFPARAAPRGRPPGSRRPTCSIQWRAAGGGPAVGAVQPREVGELLLDAHLGVQAALLRHVAEPGAQGLVDGPALPPDRAGVGGQDAEDDAHRGGLPGAVGAHETEHLAWRNGEREPVQGHHVAVAARQSVELEHPYIRSTILPSLPPARNGRRPRRLGEGYVSAIGTVSAPVLEQRQHVALEAPRGERLLLQRPGRRLEAMIRPRVRMSGAGRAPP